MNQGSIDSTWSTRERPILLAAVQGAQTGELVDLTALQEELGLPSGVFDSTIRTLERAGYFSAYHEGGGGGSILQVHERAFRETGAWPSPEGVAEALQRALEAAADGATTSEHRSRLRAAAETLGGLAREVVVGVLIKQLGG
jgi:hypothetical protein